MPSREPRRPATSRCGQGSKAGAKPEARLALPQPSRGDPGRASSPGVKEAGHKGTAGSAAPHRPLLSFCLQNARWFVSGTSPAVSTLSQQETRPHPVLTPSSPSSIPVPQTLLSAARGVLGQGDGRPASTQPRPVRRRGPDGWRAPGLRHAHVRAPRTRTCAASSPRGRPAESSVRVGTCPSSQQAGRRRVHPLPRPQRGVRVALGNVELSAPDAAASSLIDV